MSRAAWVPSVPEVSREVIIVLAGAVIAAAIVGAVPGLRAWINEQWNGTPH